MIGWGRQLIPQPQYNMQPYERQAKVTFDAQWSPTASTITLAKWITLWEAERQAKATFDA
jgi:hypothetical protein